MTTLRSICVYCGSSFGTRPTYIESAQRIGADMARAGVRLVYGGGDVGLMGATARAVIDHGGSVTGIIPKFLQRRERMLTEVEDLIVTDDMHERKRLMFERADAFVALPGGVGTLEELVEQMTWAQLGQHRKPIVLANIDGFWTQAPRPHRPYAGGGLHSGGDGRELHRWPIAPRTSCRMVARPLSRRSTSAELSMTVSPDVL